MGLTYKCSISFILLLLCAIASPAYAINDLVARVPGSTTQYPASIKNTLIVTEPHGNYVEQSIYLEYSDNYSFPGSNKVEIIHRFELPEGSVVNDLWLWMGNNIMRAIMLDTWTARHLYDSIVSMKRDPAFLSKIGNQYELHVYPLTSGSTRKIKINIITPTKWLAGDAFAEFPLKYLKASSSATLPVTMLFRIRDNNYGSPKIVERPDISFWSFIDTAGFNYKKTVINDIKTLQSFNLSFSTSFTNGVFFGNNVVPHDYNYFQFGIIPWKTFNITTLDTLPKRIVAGIDLSGFYYKNYVTLMPNLKSVIKSSLRTGDFFNMLVSGAGKVKVLSSDFVSYTPAAVDTMLNRFVASTFGDSVKLSTKPKVLYCDFSANTMWTFLDINNYATVTTKTSIIEARPLFSTNTVVAAYRHGFENSLTSTEADLVISSLDSMFLRGGRFLTYFDLNRVGREKLATHYIPTLGINYKTQNTIQIFRNIDGNIGQYFPESMAHGGGYFFNFTDSTVKKELVDANGNACVISKRLGNGGLLVVSGLWSFSDDDGMKKMLAVPMLGLNQVAGGNMLVDLLAGYNQINTTNNIDRYITFSNTDSLFTTTGTDTWVDNYLTAFTTHPVFKSVNLLDGSSVTPPSITILGKEYYGNGYLLQRLADKSRGTHFETHFTEWTTIAQRFIPSVHNYLDSVKITAELSQSTDTLKEFMEVNIDRSDPDKPLFFLGKTNGTNNVTFNIDVKFDGIAGVQHTFFNYPFAVDTTNKLQVIPSIMGNEKLKTMFMYSSTDTAGIVKLAMKYNLVCDYTGLIALEPNDTIHYMIDPFDETGLPVELYSFTADTSSAGIKLTWITATEKNNSGFEVERKDASGKFVSLGFIRGSGTSSEKHTYSFVDNDASCAVIVYRLKMIDFNGTISYSNEIKLSISMPTEFRLEQNYPNPFNPATTIRYELPQAGIVTLKIYDILGKEVVTLVNEQKDAGRYTVQFNASKLASGVYVYRLKVNDFISTKKMTLIK